MKAILNGVEIFYRLTGPAGSPTVLLVHGFPFSSSTWDAQARFLEKDFQVLTYDLRGLGQSSLGKAPQLLEAYVDDLFALMEHLKLPSVAVVGLSMGGYIALRAAQRSPEKFWAMVLCDTKSEADNDEGKLKRALGIKAVGEKGVTAFCEGMMASLVADPLSDSSRSLLKIMCANSAQGIANALAAMAGRTDTTIVLSTLKMPTLVIHGESDKLMPVAVAQNTAQHIPGAKLVVLTGAGHVSNLDKPDAFNQALGAFLSQK